MSNAQDLLLGYYGLSNSFNGYSALKVSGYGERISQISMALCSESIHCSPYIGYNRQEVTMVWSGPKLKRTSAYPTIEGNGPCETNNSRQSDGVKPHNSAKELNVFNLFFCGIKSKACMASLEHSYDFNVFDTSFAIAVSKITN